MQSNDVYKQVSFLSVLEALKRRKFLILIPTVLFAIGFGIWAYRLPDRYRTKALLAAEPMATAHDYLDAAGTRHATHIVNIDEQLRKVKEIVYSNLVLETVIKEFQLYDRVSDWSLQDLKTKITLEAEKDDPLHQHSQPTWVSFYIGFEGNDRQKVTGVTNRLVQLFIDKASSARGQRAENVAEFIDAELAQLKEKLTRQDERIKNYKQRAVHELPELTDTNLKILETLQGQVLTKNENMTNELARRTAVVQELQELEKQGLTPAEAPREKSAAEVRLEELRLKQEQLQRQYTEQHPEINRVRNEIRDVEKLVGSTSAEKKRTTDPSPLYMRSVQLKAELQSIDQRLNSYRKEQPQLASQMALYQRRIESAPTHERALVELMRDYSMTLTQYQTMLDKQQEAKLAKRFESESKDMVFRVAESAPVPLAPFEPHRDRIILMGLFSGLGLGLILAFFAERMTTSFDNVEEFQSFTNLPVVAIIPGASAGMSQGKRLKKNTIVSLSDPRSIAAEQYNILAMKVTPPPDKESSKILVVTSSSGGEGKTVTAINLGLALSASTEGSVLLIDSDLRKPRVHEYLNLPVVKGRSFGDLLQKPDDDLDKYIWKKNNLHIIPGRSSPSNPVGLLASSKARDLLARLRARFRFIVIDSPPLLPIADSHFLAGLADETILVVRARHTPRAVFQRAMESLEASNLLGVVLNDVDYQRSRYASAYKYYSKHYMGKAVQGMD